MEPRVKPIRVAPVKTPEGKAIPGMHTVRTEDGVYLCRDGEPIAFRPGPEFGADPVWGSKKEARRICVGIRPWGLPKNPQRALYEFVGVAGYPEYSALGPDKIRMVDGGFRFD